MFGIKNENNKVERCSAGPTSKPFYVCALWAYQFGKLP